MTTATFTSINPPISFCKNLYTWFYWLVSLPSSSLPSHQCHHDHFPSFFLLYFTPTSLDWSSPSFTPLSSPFIHPPAFLYFLLFSNVLALYIGFHCHHTIITLSPHSPFFLQDDCPLTPLSSYCSLLLLSPHPSFYFDSLHAFNHFSSLSSTPHNILILSCLSPSAHPGRCCIRVPMATSQTLLLWQCHKLIEAIIT